MKKILFFMNLILFICSAAFAEEKEEASVLGKTLDTTLKPLKGLLTPSVRLDPIVVTPTRYEDPSLNVSNNVTIITEKDIKNSKAKYAPEVLRQEAGIIVGDFLGNGKTVRTDMRGFGDSAASNVLVLVDGRRTNQIDLSGVDWTQIDIDAIERIEIARGPQTVLYGDNAMGGVINIITKKGKGIKPEMGFKTAWGSYRFSSYKGHIKGSHEFMDYFAMLSTSYNNGYRINNHLETMDYNTNITLKPADYLNLRCDAGYHKDWYGLPGALKPADINIIGVRGSVAPDNRAKTEDYYVMLVPELKYDTILGEIFFSSDVLGRMRRTNAIYYSQYGDVSNVNHIKTFGVLPKLAFTKELFGITNRMMAGLDFYLNKDEIDSGLLSSMDSIIINKDTIGLYITDTIELPFSFILNGGFRGEWAHYKFDQQAQLTGINEKKPFEYAYDVGLVYKYNEKSSIYAKYSRSFRFPVVDEWYTSLYIDYGSGLIAGGLNLDLKPQAGYNYEIGIKENSSKYIGIQADYYIMDLKHELYYDPITFKNSAYPRTIHHGLELKGDLYLFDAIRAFTNYTYQKAFFLGGTFAGNEIPGVPRHKLSFGLDYTFMDCVNINYIVNYVGERYFINDLKNDMPKSKNYTTHDIKFSYNKYGFEIFAALNNIFDEKYSEFGVLDYSLTNPAYYPSPRRNFLIGVNYKF